MLAADRDHALVGRVGSSVIELVAVADRLLQLQRSSGISVLSEILIDRVDGCALDVIGSRKIRLARAKIHHIRALAAKLFGIGRDLHRPRYADRRNSLCETL